MRNIKPGNLVQINTPIFTIVDNSRLEATLNAPEREIETLKAGQSVQLAVDALPGKSFAGRIDRVSPVVDSGSGTFRVICAFEGGGLLQPGMFGRIRIEYDQRANALVIPRTALLEDGTAPAVYTVKANKAARTAIKLGYDPHNFDDPNMPITYLRGLAIPAISWFGPRGFELGRYAPHYSHVLVQGLAADPLAGAASAAGYHTRLLKEAGMWRLYAIEPE